MSLTSQQPRIRGNPHLAQSQYRSSRKARTRFGNGGVRAIVILIFILSGLTAIGYLAFRNAPSPASAAESNVDRPSAELASTSRVGPSESPVRLLGSPGGHPSGSPPSGASSPMLVLDMSGGQAARTNPADGSGGSRSRRLGDPAPTAQPQPQGQPRPQPQPQPQPAPTPTAQPTPAPATTPTGTPDALPPQAASAAQVLMAEAERQQRAGQTVLARATLNRALLDRTSTTAERAQIRRWMSELNQTLVFSPTVAPGDTLSEVYTVQSGDSLERISRRLGLTPDWRFIQRINSMSNPNRLSVGQKLKVIRGPFHAVVSKSAFRVDLYHGEVPSPTSVGQSGLPDGMEPGWMYITSFPVGLGEKGSTPLGNFIVKQHSKLVNPAWVNPRTGEKFAADDPKNPIGERWVGIEGYDEASKAITGYGLHGTIEPESIGREMSMGCVRLADGPVEIVYEMLAMKISVVKIVP
ncbi:MAG: LysM peptidoglycan-binding domain-containing protein [Phycisphaeraceae bacterium]|nr:LysM peptidoglycan-binding domain-containing protein [Phycisphaeraceae bacterium]